MKNETFWVWQKSRFDSTRSICNSALGLTPWNQNYSNFLSDICNSDQLSCKSGQCVGKNKICDGVSDFWDCADGSDEGGDFCGKFVLSHYHFN